MGTETGRGSSQSLGHCLTDVQAEQTNGRPGFDVVLNLRQNIQGLVAQNLAMLEGTISAAEAVACQRGAYFKTGKSSFHWSCNGLRVTEGARVAPRML